jgi:hypothetical protein
VTIVVLSVQIPSLISIILRPCLEHSIFIVISKETDSYDLLTSVTIWNKGTLLPFSLERILRLHKTQEIESAVRAKGLVEARDKEADTETIGRLKSD